MARTLSLPTIQNWSCHSCGNCCRDHQIVVTEEERQRILDQNWKESDGVPEGMKAFVAVRGQALGKFRLANRENGACVFLDENNRCRIHAKFGEKAKPLACQIFPFTFQPGGNNAIAVGLRFNCPSAAANQGTALATRRNELQVLAEQVVPQQKWPAPKITAGQQLEWQETLRIIRRLRDMVVEGGGKTPLPERLVQAVFVASTLMGGAMLEGAKGKQIDQVLEAVVQSAPQEMAGVIEASEEPSSLAKTQFRLIVAQYAMRDTLLNTGFGYRLRKMLGGLKMTRGSGQTPAIGQELRPVAFADLERPKNGATAEIDVLYARYFDVKLMGMEFCGRACFDLGVAEGFVSLAMVYPVSMYLARWLACNRGHEAMALADAQDALAIVDHNYGRSPLMGQNHFRQRVRWLCDHGDVGRLVMWYSR